MEDGELVAVRVYVMDEQTVADELVRIGPHAYRLDLGEAPGDPPRSEVLDQLAAARWVREVPSQLAVRRYGLGV